jgi:hypothetical protein
MTYLLKGAARPLYTRQRARQRNHQSPTPGAARTCTRASDRNGIHSQPHPRNGIPNDNRSNAKPTITSQPSHTNESAGRLSRVG